MPTYTIKDSDKDEIFDTICTYDELQVFLENNPQCQKVITAPNIVSGNGPKSDGGFNETMAKIADSHPNSPLEWFDVRHERINKMSLSSIDS